jgi:very-short-patch-repair endonuclease
MRGQTNKNILGPALQKRLRKAPTDAERKLWQRLRGKQLDGCKFRRQHPYFDYILDFVCVERRLVVELDGSQHLDQADADHQRDARLAADGYRVLRFWNDDALQRTEDVLEAVFAALRDPLQPHPPPPAAERNDATPNPSATTCEPTCSSAS